MSGAQLDEAIEAYRSGQALAALHALAAYASWFGGRPYRDDLAQGAIAECHELLVHCPEDCPEVKLCLQRAVDRNRKREKRNSGLAVPAEELLAHAADPGASAKATEVIEADQRIVVAEKCREIFDHALTSLTDKDHDLVLEVYVELQELGFTPHNSDSWDFPTPEAKMKACYRAERKFFGKAYKRTRYLYSLRDQDHCVYREILARLDNSPRVHKVD